MSRIKRNAPNPVIPLFIEKLSNILEDQTCQAYVSWTSSGDAFDIKDINRFTDIVLPKYFKHSNFSSFIRQLNMYGFNKIRSDQGDNVYTNQNFKRDQKQLLQYIKRKINQVQKQDKVAIYSPSSGHNINKQLSDLKSRQRNLQSMCKQLIDQNNRILQQNNVMMKRLATEQKQKNSKMEQLLVSLIMARGSNQLALPSSEQPRMLSLTSQKPDYGSNFQQFRQFLEDSNQNNRLQDALRKFQNEQKKRNKSKNYTIINPLQHQESKPQNMQDQLKLDLENSDRKQEKKVQNSQLDNSMYSLGDFLNLDQNPIDHQTPL